MRPPAPTALRLVCAAPVVRPPRPLFGLAAWAPQADGLAVLLDATEADLDDPAAVARQVPPAATLSPGTPVFVLGAATRTRSGLGRWLGPATVAVPRAARCAALLARGYTSIGALVDEKSGADLAYGLS